MNLEFLLNDFRERSADLEQAAREHDTHSMGVIGNGLHMHAKRLRMTLKWIMRLSKHCPTLTAKRPDDDV